MRTTGHYVHETTIKGGLPVIVTANVGYDRRDAYCSVDFVSVHWKSGKSVTNKVFNSIPESDWERIEQEIMQ